MIAMAGVLAVVFATRKGQLQGELILVLIFVVSHLPFLEDQNILSPDYSPTEWLLCHLGLYWSEFEFDALSGKVQA